MTIWIFGDSFAEIYVKDNNSKQWPEYIADHLKIGINGKGLHGTSLSYTYKEFNNNRNNMKKNDIVIIVLTSMQRRWFFSDRPESAVSLIQSVCSKEEYEANKYYRLYLDNNIDIENSYLINFLYNLNSFTNKLKLKTIVINQSDETKIITDKIKKNINYLHVANGMLSCVTLKEMSDDFLKKWLSLANSDARTNHLCRSNHLILANKIIDFLTKNEEINLNKGFIENIIDFKIKEDLYNYEFYGISYKKFNLF